MRLTYTVLWFEDDPDWLGVAQQRLKTFLDTQGFDLAVISHKNGKKIGELCKRLDKRQLDVDLILMDYKLADTGENGGSLIERIREHSVFTEVVFYSQSEDVRQKATGVDGVYFTTRQEFHDKATKVLLLTIRRMQDLNNMRGMVMAETTELEALLLEGTRKLLNKSGTVLDERVERLRQMALGGHNSKKVRLEKHFARKDYDSIFEGLGHHDKWEIVRDLFGKEAASKAKNRKLTLILKSYKADVIDIRNLLAHAREVKMKGGRKMLVNKQKQWAFDDKKCVSIRKKLRKHGQNLERIQKAIQ